MSRLFSLGSLFVSLAALLPPAAATAAAPTPVRAEWPQFRGPNRDDVSPDKGLLRQWPQGGPKLLWKSQGIGIGFSSISVAGDKIFTMGDKDGSSHVFALDRTGGDPLWSVRVGKAGGNYAGTRCTPTVDGDLLYALGQFGDLVCLETASGKERWRKNLLQDFKGQSGGWNYTESPLVDGDKLICTPGGREATIVALDKKSGDVIWKSPVGGAAGYASAVISSACGTRQYVQLLADGVVGVAAEDGRLLWKYEKLGHNTANIPTPIVKGDQLFCAAGYGKGGALLTLSRSDDGIKVTEEYYRPELKNKHGGLVIVGDYVYGDRDDSGHPQCARWKTGKVVWQQKGQSKGRSSASVTYADGRLYVRYANGYVALADAGPQGYRERGGFKIPNSDQNSWSHPVVVGGRLYLREKDTLWCYDVRAK